MNRLRPTDLVPKEVVDELVVMERTYPDWFGWRFGATDGTYEIVLKHERSFGPVIRKMSATGIDLFTFKSLAVWVTHGPKVFQATPAQCRFFADVEVNLLLGEYVQPYQAMAVQFPAGAFEPYKAALCYWEAGGGAAGSHGPGPCLIVVLFSRDHLNDITTSVGGCYKDQPIENSLVQFHHDCQALADIASAALRAAVNMCLALAHFGHNTSPMFPHDVERDQRLAREQSPRGQRARERLARVETVVAFRQDIDLAFQSRHTADRGGAVAASTDDPVGTAAGHGSEKESHWRRGHWAMQPCGPGRSERKRIFRPPVLVRADRFAGDLANTSASYRVGV